MFEHSGQKHFGGPSWPPMSNRVKEAKNSTKHLLTKASVSINVKSLKFGAPLVLWENIYVLTPFGLPYFLGLWTSWFRFRFSLSKHLEHRMWKQSWGCCAMNYSSLSSLNLVLRQLRLCNIILRNGLLCLVLIIEKLWMFKNLMHRLSEMQSKGSLDRLNVIWITKETHSPQIISSMSPQTSCYPLHCR